MAVTRWYAHATWLLPRLVKRFNCYATRVVPRWRILQRSLSFPLPRVSVAFGHLSTPILTPFRLSCILYHLLLRLYTCSSSSFDVYLLNNWLDISLNGLICVPMYIYKWIEGEICIATHPENHPPPTLQSMSQNASLIEYFLRAIDSLDKLDKGLIKLIRTNRHLWGMKGVLHHEIAIDIIDLLHVWIHIALLWWCQQ